MLFLQNCSMKTLLLTYSAIFSITFSTISYVTGYFGGRIIIEEFLNQSEIIYERANTNKFSYATHYYSYLNSYFQINANPLITLNQIYLAYYTKIYQNSSINQNNFGGIESYPSIIANKDKQSSSDSILCYAFKNQFNQSDINQIQQVSFSDFLGSIGQIIHPQFDQNHAFLYGYIIDQPKPLYSYPCYASGNDILDYQPETRPWFILAQNISKKSNTQKEYQYGISDPYKFNQDQKVGITLALPLIDRFFQFKGAWCLDIFSDYLQQTFHIKPIIQETQKMLIEFKDVYILILTKDGIIINQPGNYHVYFYDHNVTGFNKNDWDQLQNNNQYYKFTNLKTKSQQTIIKFYLTKQQLYFLLQFITLIQVSIIDNTRYQDYLTECKRTLQEKIDEALRQTIILLFAAYFSMFFFAYLMITKLIVQPLKQIINCFKIVRPKTLKEKYEDLLRWRFKIKRKPYISPQIMNLQNAVYYLNNFNFQQAKQKSSQCLLIEKFQFHKKENKKKIKLKTLRLKDFNTLFDDFSFNRNEQNSNLLAKMNFLENNYVKLFLKDKLSNQLHIKKDLSQYLNNQIQLTAFSFVKSILTQKSEIFNEQI